MTPEKKLSKARISLLTDPKLTAYCGLLVVGSSNIDNSMCPTACTDGYDEWWNSEFIENSSIKELAFCVLHEAMHKMYKHLYLYIPLYKENADLANRACDYVINLDIMSIGAQSIELPKGALYDKRFADMTVKQVFDILKQEPKQKGSYTFDIHKWAPQGPKDLERIVREIDMAIQQGKLTKNMGGNSDGLNLSISDLMQSKVSWEQQLRDWANSYVRGTEESSWARPNRRYISNDVYMPSLCDPCINELIIAVDTSGSIDKEYLTRFFSEVVEIPSINIRLLYWDTAISGDELFTSVDNIKVTGGGGTSPSCILPYIQEKGYEPEGIIVLTDGEFNTNQCFDYNKLLWVVFGNNNTMPTGITINVSL